MADRAQGTNGDIDGTGRAAVAWPWRALAAAVPVANTAGAFPGSRERSTTIITFP